MPQDEVGPGCDHAPHCPRCSGEGSRHISWPQWICTITQSTSDRKVRIAGKSHRCPTRRRLVSPPRHGWLHRNWYHSTPAGRSSARSAQGSLALAEEASRPAP